MVRKLPDQDRVHSAEHRRRGPHAQSKSQHRHKRESRSCNQRANRMPYILPHAIHHVLRAIRVLVSRTDDAATLSQGYAHPDRSEPLPKPESQPSPSTERRAHLEPLVSGGSQDIAPVLPAEFTRQKPQQNAEQSHVLGLGSRRFGED